ncbi:peptidase [Acinetobacter dispersus]|uniref:peptidase n=1 Tax=Acinetobacter dispersus TaxID=70348 RepID=UPI0021CD4E23|nr:peptidase [Acinetobacter dispersus]MCU4338214.1 peptidase [Acinetobacter dispersus]
MAFFETPKTLLDIFTNKKEGSIKEVKIETPSRPLTNGEIQLAKSIFKNTLNYTVIKIFFGSFFPLKSQNEDTFVTPNGSIYIMPKHYRDDYSLESISYKKIFLHEIGHVWQHQRKLNVLANAGALQACSVLSNFSYDPYVYNIWETPTVAQLVKHKNITKRFLDYNLESQAEILADYWVLKNNHSVTYMLERNRKNTKGRSKEEVLSMYEEKIRQVIN